MSYVRIENISIENYRSFGKKETIYFPDESYKKPVSIVGYNNSGKTNFLNAILYGITAKYVNKDTFTLDDFHNRRYENIPLIETKIKSSIEVKGNGNEAELTGYHSLNITIVDDAIENANFSSYTDKEKTKKHSNSFGAAKYFKMFYINFHEIKRELTTKKQFGGSLSSFLAKHIKNIVEKDREMIKKKESFKEEIKNSTEKILEDSELSRFINRIQLNYSRNLRQNNCHIDFSLPDYQDIFLEMIFKIGLNGDTENLIPIEHFGDGYISMFVMAIIQAIAESNAKDKCLFLFEEPESFLHENHQEYFYKTVLCELSEKGHQVIYTTHSDKMIDIFDTKGLIRLGFDEKNKETIVKYNKSNEELVENDNEWVFSEINDYNNYIKLIEPNLNKIIFSEKVVLVEGPNDLMTYKEIIKKKIYEVTKNIKYSETYLNFHNISIIPHHGKITAIILIKLCKHLGIDFFCINDFDFGYDFTNELLFDSVEDLQASNLYTQSVSNIIVYNSKGDLLTDTTKRGMITTNWRLINEASFSHLHFNIPKLEAVIGYVSNDKDSAGIWRAVQNKSEFGNNIFPSSLKKFLGLKNIEL